MDLQKDFIQQPAPESVRIINFDKASLHSVSIDLETHLNVSGEKPYLNMEVKLVPRVYVKKPEYWGIEVVGYLNGIGLPTMTPYDVSMPVGGTMGTKGIEVIGANKTQRLEKKDQVFNVIDA